MDKLKFHKAPIALSWSFGTLNFLRSEGSVNTRIKYPTTATTGIQGVP